MSIQQILYTARHWDAKDIRKFFFSFDCACWKGCNNTWKNSTLELRGFNVQQHQLLLCFIFFGGGVGTEIRRRSSFQLIDRLTEQFLPATMTCRSWTIGSRDGEPNFTIRCFACNSWIGRMSCLIFHLNSRRGCGRWVNGDGRRCWQVAPKRRCCHGSWNADA